MLMTVWLVTEGVMAVGLATVEVGTIGPVTSYADDNRAVDRMG